MIYLRRYCYKYVSLYGNVNLPNSHILQIETEICLIELKADIYKLHNLTVFK